MGTAPSRPSRQARPARPPQRGGLCGFETTVPFVSSLREAENEKWLSCFSGDFCQIRPCVARTGLCPGGAGRSPPGMETGHTGLSGGNQGACVVLWDGWLRRVPPVPEGTQGTQNSARGGVGGICVTCWEIHRDARGESVGHFSSRVTQNAGELDLQHTKYRILFTVTCPPCTLLMGPEQERRSQQRGSQPAPNFQRHLRHWW